MQDVSAKEIWNAQNHDRCRSRCSRRRQHVVVDFSIRFRACPPWRFRSHSPRLRPRPPWWFGSRPPRPRPRTPRRRFCLCSPRRGLRSRPLRWQLRRPRFGGSPYHGGYDHGGESSYRGYAYRAAPLYGGYDYGGQSYDGGQAYYGDSTDDSGPYDGDFAYAREPYDGSNYTDTSARGSRSRRAAAHR